jgi:hypothetical protein
LIFGKFGGDGAEVASSGIGGQGLKAFHGLGELFARSMTA